MCFQGNLAGTKAGAAVEIWQRIVAAAGAALVASRAGRCGREPGQAELLGNGHGIPGVSAYLGCGKVCAVTCKHTRRNASYPQPLQGKIKGEGGWPGNSDVFLFSVLVSASLHLPSWHVSMLQDSLNTSYIPVPSRKGRGRAHSAGAAVGASAPSLRLPELLLPDTAGLQDSLLPPACSPPGSAVSPSFPLQPFRNAAAHYVGQIAKKTQGCCCISRLPQWLAASPWEGWACQEV